MYLHLGADGRGHQSSKLLIILGGLVGSGRGNATLSLHLVKVLLTLLLLRGEASQLAEALGRNTILTLERGFLLRCILVVKLVAPDLEAVLGVLSLLLLLLLGRVGALLVE